MSEWIELVSICKINYGKSPNGVLKPGANVPVVGTGGIERYADKFIYEGESVILGRKGTINNPIFINGKFWPIDTTFYLTDFKNINVKYLYYCLLQAKLERLNESTGVPSVSRDSLYKVVIPYKKVDEQARIAKILSTVDAAIEQTEALIAKYSRIRTGLMQDLLTRGDELQSVTLNQLADVSAGITLGKKHEGPDTVERPYLRVANVQDGYLNLSEITYIRIPRSQVDRYQLQNGDVLMNEGGDFDKLGRGTVWRDEIPGCLHQNHVFRVRCYTNFLLPDYLALISASPYGKRFFVLNSKQSTNLASINSTQLKSFPIPLPDIKEQQRLIDIFKKKTAVLETHKNHLAKLQTLKKGLMQDLLSEPRNTNWKSQDCN